MDKQPVGQLPDLAQSNNDDEIMVITNSEYNKLKKEKISDLITDFTSTNENNALTKGTDGKMFVTDFGNASNITEGTLPVSVLPDIPKDLLPAIETSDLPVSGVSADTYAYPSSVTVNAQGQVTAIEEGTPSGANANTDLSNLTDEGEKHFLNKTQITNCMLEAPNGIATYSGTTVTVQEGTNYLFPNGRNSNNTLQNTTFTAASNITGTMSGSTADTFVVFVTSESSLIFANNINYFITSTEPTALNDTKSQGVWYNPVLNTLSQCAATASTPSWSTFEGAICATLTYDGSTITAFNPIYPIELSNKLNTDHSNDTKPYITETYVNGTEGYILFSNNFSIQWGRVYAQNESLTDYVVNLLLEMADTNYSCSLSLFSLSTGYTDLVNSMYFQAWNLTTTSFTTKRYINNEINSMWVVLGYVA